MKSHPEGPMLLWETSTERMHSEEFRHRSISGSCPNCTQAPLALAVLQLSHKALEGLQLTWALPLPMDLSTERNHGGTGAGTRVTEETVRRCKEAKVFVGNVYPVTGGVRP